MVLPFKWNLRVSPWFWNVGNFRSWYPESWALEFGIKLEQEPSWLLARGIQKHASDWNVESKFHWQAIWNPQCRIQNPGLSWMNLHGAKPHWQNFWIVLLVSLNFIKWKFSLWQKARNEKVHFSLICTEKFPCDKLSSWCQRFSSERIYLICSPSRFINFRKIDIWLVCTLILNSKICKVLFQQFIYLLFNFKSIVRYRVST